MTNAKNSNYLYCLLLVLSKSILINKIRYLNKVVDIIINEFYYQYIGRYLTKWKCSHHE